jgi:hypothetical protein
MDMEQYRRTEEIAALLRPRLGTDTASAAELISRELFRRHVVSVAQTWALVARLARSRDPANEK